MDIGILIEEVEALGIVFTIEPCEVTGLHDGDFLAVRIDYPSFQAEDLAEDLIEILRPYRKNVKQFLSNRRPTWPPPNLALIGRNGIATDNHQSAVDSSGSTNRPALHHSVQREVELLFRAQTETSAERFLE